MEVKHMERIEKQVGTASIVKADDFIQKYSEGVQKFLRDNQSNMGDEWVQMAGSKLYNFQGKNKEGDILGSSIDIGVAIATFTDIPLITGKQLMEIYRQAGNRNPFGNFYVDFGVMVCGTPDVNNIQARILLDNFKMKGIKIEDGRILDFAQLKLITDKNKGLAYKLKEGVSSDNVALVSEYPFKYSGKNGLFRAYFDWDGSWYAGDLLAISGDCGRVVRYDAEGVARVAPKIKENLVEKLALDFAKKF